MVIIELSTSAWLLVMIFVFLRFMLRPTNRLSWFSSCSILCSSSLLFAKMMISSANRRWLMNSPSILMSQFSHCNFWKTFSRQAVKSFGEVLSPWRTPRPRWNGLEQGWPTFWSESATEIKVKAAGAAPRNNLSSSISLLRCHGYLGSDKRRATEASDWPLLISAAYQHPRMSYRPRELIDCYYVSIILSGTEPWWREKCWAIP